MGNYVTVATRPHPTIGYDPCPGSPEGTSALASQIRDFAWKIEDLSVFLQGARSDIDYGGWIGDSRRAFQEAMVEFPPKLNEFKGALESVHGALDGWAEELTGFQERSLVLDEELRTAQQASTAAATAMEQWEDTGDNRHELLGLQDDQLAAANLLRDAQAAVTGLENEYRDRAEHYGGIINGAGNRSWDRGFWDALGDIGDWLEDSFIGDFARWSAPFWDVVSEWGGWISAGLTVLGGVSLFVFPPAAPFLFLGAGITGGLATIGDGMLAASGFQGWGPVGLGLVTLGIGKGVAKAGDKIIEVYQRTGRADELIDVRVGSVTGTYRPSLFTATEMHQDELVWHFVELKGKQAEWGITGYSLAQSFVSDGEARPVQQDYSGFTGGNPWDLPPNIAYLEDRDGELVK